MPCASFWMAGNARSGLSRPSSRFDGATGAPAAPGRRHRQGRCARWWASCSSGRIADSRACRAAHHRITRRRRRMPSCPPARSTRRPQRSRTGGRRIAVLAQRLPLKAHTYVTWVNAGRRPDQYGHELYANLRTLDRAGCRRILVQEVPADERWDAVRDRLTRAASGAGEIESIARAPSRCCPS